MRFAAIDIGTVTCRLLVADVEQGKLCELKRLCAITNLGVGVDETGFLQDEAISRVRTQVAEYLRIVGSYRDAEHPDIQIEAIATSASRDARNVAVLLEQLHNEGLELSVISGQQEANLSFIGSSQHFVGEEILVVDIGGGSTETIIGLAPGRPDFVHSFSIGCRRLTERFFNDDPPKPYQLNEARNLIRRELETVLLPALQGRCIGRIVAVAGTATSVVSIDKHMHIYNSAQVDGTLVNQQTLKLIFDDLSAMELSRRKQVVGLEPERAEVIVAGMLILLELLHVCSFEHFTVSESDILQGIIIDAANQTGEF